MAAESASSGLLVLSAVIGAVAALGGAVLGYYIQNRGEKTLAREERSWQRKSDAYVELIGLMHRYGIELGVYDAGFLVAGGPVTDDEIPTLLAARLRTFGSTEVQKLLRIFWQARENYRRITNDRATSDDAKKSAKEEVEQSISNVEAQVKSELSA